MAVLVGLIVIGANVGDGEPEPTVPAAADQPAAASPDVPEPAPAEPETVRPAFGEPYTSTNEEITIGEPQPYEQENQFLLPDPGNRYVAFDVTVRNIGSQDFDVISTEITVQHNGRVGQESHLDSTSFPTTRIPPGGEVTFTKVFEIGEEPGELQVSVRPDFFAGTTAYYVGQF